MTTRMRAAGMAVTTCLANIATASTISSPDARITVRFALSSVGGLTYAVTMGDQVVLEPSPLGIETSCGTWDSQLELVSCTAPERIRAAYRLLHGKRRDCTYEANQCVVTVRNTAGQELRVVFQARNDGVAFRYELPGRKDGKHATIVKELTGFDFPNAARAWLMPMDPGGSGWCRVQPCYEGYYQEEVPVTTASPTGAGWAMPALFRVGDCTWALIAESDTDGQYCGTRLGSPSGQGLFCIEFPDANENNGKGDVQPTVSLPFLSPWRVIMLGAALGPIVESTMITDLAEPSRLPDTSFIRPGRSTWSWLIEKDGATVFDRQKEYVDLAAKLGFEYCLVDALWDVQIGYDKMRELVQYATDRHVGILLWYNSNGNWNDAPQTPKNRMHSHEVRMEEFARLGELGVRGVKVDFFGGDKQVTMQLYMDLLKDAADAGIMVNCHGATIPRGWERTWPNLMTMEAVRGYENYTFRQEDAEHAPSHCCMVPFTRNVIGPMDFTPTCLGPYLDTNNVIRRRTSDAFELALAVVYESGIQHFGVTPDDIERAPEFVVGLLRSLPTSWDDIRFLDGFPGTYIVLARRSGERWFVAGVNGQDEPQAVVSQTGFLTQSSKGTLIFDNIADSSLAQQPIKLDPGTALKLTLPPRGGFVLRIDPAAAPAARP